MSFPVSSGGSAGKTIPIRFGMKRYTFSPLSREERGATRAAVGLVDWSISDDFLSLRSAMSAVVFRSRARCACRG